MGEHFGSELGAIAFNAKNVTAYHKQVEDKVKEQSTSLIDELTKRVAASDTRETKEGQGPVPSSSDQEKEPIEDKERSLESELTLENLLRRNVLDRPFDLREFQKEKWSGEVPQYPHQAITEEIKACKSRQYTDDSVSFPDTNINAAGVGNTRRSPSNNSISTRTPSPVNIADRQLSDPVRMLEPDSHPKSEKWRPIEERRTRAIRKHKATKQLTKHYENYEIWNIAEGHPNVKKDTDSAIVFIADTFMNIIGTIATLASCIGYMPVYKEYMAARFDVGKQLCDGQRFTASTSKGLGESPNNIAGIVRRGRALYSDRRVIDVLDQQRMNFDDNRRSGVPSLIEHSLKNQRRYQKALAEIGILSYYMTKRALAYVYSEPDEAKINVYTHKIEQSIKKFNELIVNLDEELRNYVLKMQNDYITNQFIGNSTLRMEVALRKVFTVQVKDLETTIQTRVREIDGKIQAILSIKEGKGKEALESDSEITETQNISSDSLADREQLKTLTQLQAQKQTLQNIFGELKLGSFETLIDMISKIGVDKAKNLVGDIDKFPMIKVCIEGPARINKEIDRVKNVVAISHYRKIATTLHHRNIFDTTVTSVGLTSSIFTLGIWLISLVSLISIGATGNVGSFIGWFNNWGWSLCLSTFFLTACVKIAHIIFYERKRRASNSLYKKNRLVKASFLDLMSKLGGKNPELFYGVYSQLTDEQIKIWENAKEKAQKSYTSQESGNQGQKEFGEGERIQKNKDRSPLLILKRIEAGKGELNDLLEEIKNSDSLKDSGFSKLSKEEQAQQLIIKLKRRISDNQPLKIQLDNFELSIRSSNIHKSLNEIVMIDAYNSFMKELRQNDPEAAEQLSADLKYLRIKVHQNYSQFKNDIDGILKAKGELKNYALHRNYIKYVKDDTRKRKDHRYKRETVYRGAVATLVEAYGRLEVLEVPEGFSRIDAIHCIIPYLRHERFKGLIFDAEQMSAPVITGDEKKKLIANSCELLELEIAYHKDKLQNIKKSAASDQSKMQKKMHDIGKECNTIVRLNAWIKMLKSKNNPTVEQFKNYMDWITQYNNDCKDKIGKVDGEVLFSKKQIKQLIEIHNTARVIMAVGRFTSGEMEQFIKELFKSPTKDMVERDEPGVQEPCRVSEKTVTDLKNLLLSDKYISRAISGIV